jgi:BTB/POZ domain
MSITPSTECPKDTSPTAFGPPFDDPDADIILRSSDQVDFHVYRVILSKASPVFKDMFSLPQPGGTDTTLNSHTVIDLPESSRTLATLLTAIYPISPMSETDEEHSLSDHLAAIQAAKKYDMAVASEFFLRNFKDSTCVQDSPVKTFCVAYGLQLGEAAQIAAKASLKHRLSMDDIGDELQHTNRPALFQLWQFHRACSAAAITAISISYEDGEEENLTWITKATQSRWWELTEPDRPTSCQCGAHDFWLGESDGTFALHEYFNRLRWAANASWSNYINRARDALRKHPCSEAVTHHDILKPSYKQSMCHECQKRICGLSEFSRYLGEEVDRRTAQVRRFLLPFLTRRSLVSLWRLLWICRFDIYPYDRSTYAQ